MKAQNVSFVVSVVAIIIAGFSMWRAQDLQARVDYLNGQWRAVSEQTGTNTEDRVKHLEAAAPGVGEIMAGIQEHAAKLYFAAEAKNWPLAEFETEEIEGGLAAVPVLRPEEKGVPLGAVIDAFKRSQWAALKDAVARQDIEAFQKAYAETLFVCNACHQATGRPFIQIIQPTQPPVSNQRWEPAPPAVQ